MKVSLGEHVFANPLVLPVVGATLTLGVVATIAGVKPGVMVGHILSSNRGNGFPVAVVKSVAHIQFIPSDL